MNAIFPRLRQEIERYRMVSGQKLLIWSKSLDIFAFIENSTGLEFSRFTHTIHARIQCLTESSHSVLCKTSNESFQLWDIMTIWLGVHFEMAHLFLHVNGFFFFLLFPVVTFTNIFFKFNTFTYFIRVIILTTIFIHFFLSIRYLKKNSSLFVFALFIFQLI